MKYCKINKIFIKSIVFIIIVSSFFSCNLTKNLKEDQKLLSENTVIIAEDDFDAKSAGFDSDDIKDVIKPDPNKKMKLRIYNLYDPEAIELKEKIKKQKCKEKNNKQISRISKKIRKFEARQDETDVNSPKFEKNIEKLKKLQIKKEEKGQEKCNEKHWSRKNGEEPVVHSNQNTYRNQKYIRILLKNKGYYDVRVNEKSSKYQNILKEIFIPGTELFCKDPEKVLNSRKIYPGKNIIKSYCRNKINNKKKVKVEYTINPGRPTIINKIIFNIPDSTISELVFSDTLNSVLKTGNRLDTKHLETERKRMSDFIRNSGYYNFKKEYIYFSIDTLGKYYNAELSVNIKNPVNENNEEISHKKSQIRNIYIYPNYKPKEALANREEYLRNNDTLIYYDKAGNKYNFIYNDFPRINPKAIAGGIFLIPGTLFNINDVRTTYQRLASSQIILIANVDFVEHQELLQVVDTLDYLDTEVRITQDKLQSFDVSGEVTHTSGNWGIAGNASYAHNNIFKNTEVLDFKLNFAVKRITKKSYDIADTLGFFNSFEYGFDIGLKFPGLLAPLPFKKFIKRSNPRTLINGRYNYLKEPGYSTSNAGFSFGYNWYSTNTINHAFTPVSLDFVKLIDPSESFRAWLDSFHLEKSYEDHMVFGSSYRFTFNNQLFSKKKNFFFFTVYTKLAGNSLSMISKWTKKEKTDNSYTAFENVFAQFIKSEIDFRYYRKLDREKDKLIFRLFTGVAFPYGNLNVIPFSEQYYSGGANGLRAWRERSLGPGTYNETDTVTFPNLRSDMKLELNIEYRMKLFWYLEGALFVDIGNIWAINDEDSRLGAKFDFEDFYRELAVGPGFGFRFDFDLIVVRLDLGRKLFDPSREIYHRFVPAGRDSFLDNFRNNWTINIGIGYPF